MEIFSDGVEKTYDGRLTANLGWQTWSDGDNILILTDE